MRGFFKRITIGNEIRYRIEFSLEEIQQLCAVACPLHMSSAGCNGPFSVRLASSSTSNTRAKKTRSDRASRGKRIRFT